MTAGVMPDTIQLLAFALDQGASDVHITTGEPPVLRVDSDLESIQLAITARRDRPLGAVHPVTMANIAMCPASFRRIGEVARRPNSATAFVRSMKSTASSFTLASIDARSVVIANGNALTAELVVVGIGVRPAVALAEGAGLAMIAVSS